MLGLDFVQNVDDVLEFMFEVMGIAVCTLGSFHRWVLTVFQSELLLDRLSLLCSVVILRHININNVCSVLTDASYFSANQLIASLQGFVARNLETLLESRMLDDLQSFVVKHLATFIQYLQAKKLPLTRSGALIRKASEKYGDWLALQDIPQPIIRSIAKGPLRQSPKISPIATGKRSGRVSTGPISPSASPRFEPRPTSVSDSAAERRSRPAAVGDEVFMMDDDMHEEIPQLSLSSQSDHTLPPTVSGNSAWKSRISQTNTK